MKDIKEHGFRTVLTNAPLFRDKIRILGEDITFIVGYDTWDRFRKRDREEFASYKNVKFLVFPRGDKSINEDHGAVNHKIVHEASYHLEEDLLKISSTKIREIKSEGLPFDLLV